jgi:uncharacterized protein YifN (PemK superfamily)
LEGSIENYSDKIYSYDSANNVQDYIISITFKVSFTDNINNKSIYDNDKKFIVLSENYAVSSESTSRFKTKEEAINEICDKLFRQIMQKIMVGKLKL